MKQPTARRFTRITLLQDAQGDSGKSQQPPIENASAEEGSAAGSQRPQIDESSAQERSVARSQPSQIEKAPAQESSVAAVQMGQDIQKEVDRYSAWLAEAAIQRSASGEEARAYRERASELVHVGGQKVRPFAPFRFDLSAIKTATPEQVLILLFLVVLWAVAFFFYGIPTLVVSIAFVTTLYLGDLLLNFFLATRILNRSPEDFIDNAVARAIPSRLWPRYTVLCPLYHEAVIVPQFVRAMSLLDYPVEQLEIFLITEEDDEDTRSAILSLNLPAHFEVLTVPPGEPRTKPRACNFGLLQASGEYTVIYDAEDIPDPLQLKKAVLAFANHPPEVACVQAKLNYYNPNQNLLTRWFTVEYSLWFDLMLPALQNARAPIPLGGTSNHFRTSVLREVGAWDPFNVTEDCDLGLRLAHYHLQTAILDSTTYEEANSRLKNWLRQRSRWIKGYMQTYLVHMRHPIRYLRGGRLRDLLWLQATVGARVGMLFINPVMWLLLALYLFFQSSVIDAYHILYPRPVLYLSAASLIFGNFFFLYTYLVGCIRRRQYSLMKWTFLIPLYWLLMSVAALMALVQLILKPHYWAKTQHGFHLLALARLRAGEDAAQAAHKGKQAPGQNGLKEKQLADLPIAPIIDTLSTWRMPAIQAEFPTLDLSELGERPTGRLSVVADLPTTKLPAISQAAHPEAGRQKKRQVRLPWTKDRWLGATILTAVIMSIVGFWYSYSHQYILLYGDAYPHLKIARSIFDNIAPGIAQFGGVWLPLPHIIMLPFIWNNQLWLSGLAGSFSSMPCYVIAAIYLFLSARRLTHNSLVSFVATLAFILNPNALYLQTTPLTEPVLMATMTAACYYFLAWAQEDDPKQLIWAAAAMFLATLARYDGWALFLACLVLIVPIGWIRRQRRGQIIGNVLLFGTLGGFGIALWFLWCTIIFKDPLYFQHGPFSSELQQQGLAFAGRLYTLHNLWESVRFYAIDSLQTVGPVLFVLAGAALLLFIARRWRSPDTLSALAFWSPFVFYVVSLYTGQAAIYTPGAVPAGASLQFYNVRYGAEIIVPTALFLATLLERVPFKKIVLPAGTTALLLAIVGQSFLTFSGGVISLQDGQAGASCAPTSSITLYLAQHYNGGLILEDPHYGSNSDIMGMVNIDLKNIVEPGAGALWDQALKDPASVADWVIIGQGDLISQKIDPTSPAFLAEFTLVQQSSEGSALFYRKGLPPPPNRPVPPSLLTLHQLCPGSANDANALAMPLRAPQSGSSIAGEKRRVGGPY